MSVVGIPLSERSRLTPLLRTASQGTCRSDVSRDALDHPLLESNPKKPHDKRRGTGRAEPAHELVERAAAKRSGPHRNPGMDRVDQGRARPRRPGARAPAAGRHGRDDPPRRRPAAVLPDHRIHQHHPRRARGQGPRRFGDGVEDPLDHPLERHGHGGARQPQARRPGRPHRQLRLRRHALRRRLQPLLARAIRRPPRRPALHPGPFTRPASTRARSSKAASAKTSSTTSAWKSTAAASAATRTRG